MVKDMAATEYGTENEKRYQRLMDEAVNEGRMGIIDELVAEEFIMSVAGEPEPIRGREGLKQYIQTYRNAFPDLHLEIEDVVANDDRVCARWTVTGTHDGELSGIGATGTHVTVEGMEFDRLEDGKFTEVQEIFDSLSLLRQLGVVPDEQSP